MHSSVAHFSDKAFKFLAAVREVAELVGAGAGGGEQNCLAGGRLSDAPGECLGECCGAMAREIWISLLD